MVNTRIKMNTAPVRRLDVIARQVDELSKDLDRVAFLEGDIVNKKDAADVDDLTKKTKTTLTRLRDAIAQHGGKVVAKGYK